MEQLNFLDKKTKAAIEKLAKELNVNLENALMRQLKRNGFDKTKTRLDELIKEGRVTKFDGGGTTNIIYLLDNSIALVTINRTTKVEIENNLFTITIGS